MKANYWPLIMVLSCTGALRPGAMALIGWILVSMTDDRLIAAHLTAAVIAQAQDAKAKGSAAGKLTEIEAATID
jgi:hypothetical protein